MHHSLHLCHPFQSEWNEYGELRELSGQGVLGKYGELSEWIELGGQGEFWGELNSSGMK